MFVALSKIIPISVVSLLYFCIYR